MCEYHKHVFASKLICLAVIIKCIEKGNLHNAYFCVGQDPIWKPQCYVTCLRCWRETSIEKSCTVDIMVQFSEQQKKASDCKVWYHCRVAEQISPPWRWGLPLLSRVLGGLNSILLSSSTSRVSDSSSRMEPTYWEKKYYIWIFCTSCVLWITSKGKVLNSTKPCGKQRHGNSENYKYQRHFVFLQISGEKINSKNKH